MAESVIKKYQFEFGMFTVHQTYMVGQLAAGATFDHAVAQTAVDIALRHFSGPFGYIGNTNKAASVDPLFIKHTALPDNLKAVAVVAHRDVTRASMTLIKAVFLRDVHFQFKIANSLDEAVAWVQQVLSNA
jgi:hypothetical protein